MKQVKERLIIMPTKVGTKKWGFIDVPLSARDDDDLETAYEEYLRKQGVVASVVGGYVITY